MNIPKSLDRCCSCGACRATCEVGAISMVYDSVRGGFFPKVDESKCVSCGRCVHVCPAENGFMERQKSETDPLSVYEVYAREWGVRWNSASGGAITTIVGRLLDMGVYKRAYVVQFNAFAGVQAEVRAVDSIDELKKAAKSKYIPVSIGPVVEAVRERAIGGSIIVCTPCQLNAIKSAMREFAVPEDDVLFLGLFCDRMFTYSFYTAFKEKFGKFDELHFRDKDPSGWPGDVTLIENGNPRKVDRKERMALKKTHTMKCCEICPEKLNVEADISFGDCYTPGYSFPDGKGGVSTVVVRTDKGQKVFAACQSSFVVQSHNYDMVRHAQKTILTDELDTRVYNVCIVILGLVNRGQGLMFHAILEQLRGRLPNAVVYVDEKAYIAHADFFRRHKVFPLLDPAGIDLVLYAPGYRYSDKFAVQSEEQVIAERKSWAVFTKPGRRIVFLPQSFGPFEGALTKEMLRAATEHVDLIYAREAISSNLLEGVLGKDSRIRTSPDFTCLYNNCSASLPFPRGEYVVVIPNVQMIAKTSEASGVKYREFSKALLRHLVDRGEKVVLLDHAKDAELIAELNVAVGGACTVIERASAEACKAIIAASKLTVTSRYHGLVSGLTSGIPTFCTSWSHKYQDLCARLGCMRNCLSVDDIGHGLSVVEKALKAPDDYCVEFRELDGLRDDVYRMWGEIFSLVPDWAVRSRPLTPKLISAATRGLENRAAIVKRDAQIAHRDEQLAKREEELELRRAQLSKRDAQIEELRAKVEKRDRLLKGKDDQIAHRDEQLVKREEELELRRAQLSKRDAQIEELRAKVEKRDQLLKGRDDQIARRDEQLAKREEELDLRRAQLAKRDAQIEVLREKVEKRDHLLEKKNALLAHRDKQLDKREAMLAVRDRKLEELQKANQQTMCVLKKLGNLIA